jgi:hypothetical protein
VTWSSSPYGKTLHFLSVATLEQIRHVWTQYYEIATLGTVGKRHWEAKYTRGVQSIVRKYLTPLKEGVVQHGVRTRISWSCFHKYWETGVAAGNSDDKRDLRRCAGGRPNPLMAISSAPNREFAVHYGSDPLSGFHLASAFDNEFSDEKYASKMVELAKSQFKEWCGVFGDQHRAETIKVRVFCGDAMRFCYGLQHFYHSSSIGWRNDILRLYTSPWYSKPFDLQATQWLNQLGETQGFHIIDTSNLVDHIGLLNILPTTTPLLSKNETSVLFTNSFLKPADKASDILSVLLCSDVTTTSFLLGLAPTTHLLGHAREAYGMDTAKDLITSGRSDQQTPLHMRITWRSPKFGDLCGEGHEPSMKTTRVVFQENQLVSYFFELYKTMFSYESIGSMMGDRLRQSTSPSSADFRHYNRMSFVGLLGLAKSRHVTTDWRAFMTSLVERIEYDRELLIGLNQCQELLVLLHLSGLHSHSVFSAQNPKEHPIVGKVFGPLRSPSVGVNQGLLDQQKIPSVVWLCLKVPRRKVEVFTSQHKLPQGSGFPRLHINVSLLERNFMNSYYSTQCFFGTLIRRAGDDHTCGVVEDKDGWNGTSDLIVVCAVPAWTLLLGSAGSYRIDLTISLSPADAVIYIPRLGLMMSVYGCGLHEKNVVLLKEPPGVRLASLYRLPLPPPATNDTCFVQLNGSSRIETMEIRQALGSLSLENPKVVQVSACALSLKTSNNKTNNLLFRYPYPIDTRQAKIGLTRNTVSVIVKPSISRISGDSDHNPFAVASLPLKSGLNVMIQSLRRMRLGYGRLKLF